MPLDLSGAGKLLDTKKINDGVWVHLDSLERDPETGLLKPMYLNDDESLPQMAQVRSYRCKAMKAAEDDRQKKGFVKLRVAKKKERDNVIADNSLLPDEDRFAIFLVALKNFGATPGVQQVSAADAKALHEMDDYSHIVEQIRDAAYDDDNYKADEATAPGNVLQSTTETTTPTSTKAVEEPTA